MPFYSATNNTNTAITTTPSFRILIPIWLFNLIATILILVSSATKFITWSHWKSYPARSSVNDDEDSQWYRREAPGYLAWASILLILGLVTLSLNILSYVFVARKWQRATAVLTGGGALTFVIWAVVMVCIWAIPPGNADVWQLCGNSTFLMTGIWQFTYAYKLRRAGRVGESGARKMFDDEDGEKRQDMIEEDKKMPGVKVVVE
ncbi:uncharacterized protein RCC_00696 [Ramularia collo-cygni]|uniref:MARVEL domain-containing protein n=1 Tax=Ramularia collo-cygni TaxID=112498 RepID=A0A2D3V382_9PEZI|nr:uncharacterized protein RCC_00696 [Ramularia collo-cygni]CZT14733.1 uncharacterized protein RCC_00696 [Ramularia collo-cygni]